MNQMVRAKSGTFERTERMKFEIRDNLKAFAFAESSVEISKFTDECWELILHGVIAKYNNPLNSRYEDVFIGETTLQFDNPVIDRFLLEGCKRYDANDVLLEEVPDQELDPLTAPEIFKDMEDGVIFRIFEKDSDREGMHCLEMAVDANEADTYWLDLYFTGSYVGWERFVGPVEAHEPGGY